jgi:hypothetical protein
MSKLLIAMLVAGSMGLAACEPYEETVEAPPPPPPGAPPIQGAVLGAPAEGMMGAVWADRDNDGYADGYYYGGRYYEGRPPYQPMPPAPVRQGERG